MNALKRLIEDHEIDAMSFLSQAVVLLNCALPLEASEAREKAGVLVRKATSALRDHVPPPPTVEFHQHDWIPGFAAFAPNATTPSPDSRAFCVVNLGSALSAIQTGAMPASELPYHLAESMMHEIVHAIEQWAGVEFSEERVEALLERYRQTYQQ